MAQAGRRPWGEAGDARRIAATVPLSECLYLSRAAHKEGTGDDEPDPPGQRGTPAPVLKAQGSKEQAQLT